MEVVLGAAQLMPAEVMQMLAPEQLQQLSIKVLLVSARQSCGVWTNCGGHLIRYVCIRFSSFRSHDQVLVGYAYGKISSVEILEMSACALSHAL